jgi:hypothetical protein
LDDVVEYYDWWFFRFGQSDWLIEIPGPIGIEMVSENDRNLLVQFVIEKNKNLIPTKVRMEQLRDVISHVNVGLLLRQVENKQFFDFQYLTPLMHVV